MQLLGHRFWTTSLQRISCEVAAMFCKSHPVVCVVTHDDPYLRIQYRHVMCMITSGTTVYADDACLFKVAYSIVLDEKVDFIDYISYAKYPYPQGNVNG